MKPGSPQPAPRPRLAHLLLLAALALGLAVGAARGQDPDGSKAHELLGRIKAGGDRVPTEVVSELAGLRTPAALDALNEAYDLFQTVFMKREVVRALRFFDGVEDGQARALQRLMDEATAAPERELREAAIDALGTCRVSGKHYLKLIVASKAEDAVREQALAAHIALAEAEDNAWYHELWRGKKAAGDGEAGKPAKPRKPKKGEDAHEAEQPKSGVILNSMRLLAFEALVPTLTVEELVQAARDGYARIRKSALEDLARRGEPRTLEMAWAVVKNDGEQPENRVVAARIVAAIEGVKCAGEFVERATAFATPVELRRGLAEILAGLGDEKVNKELLRDVTRGKAWEKLFHMYAVRALPDERVDQAYVKLLTDKEEEVALTAAKLLGERRSAAAAEPLQRLFERSKSRDLRRAALEALAHVRAGDPAWIAELVALTKSDDPEVRNLALNQLGMTSDRAHVASLIAALSDPEWSTRLAALDALERLRMKEAVNAIVARMPAEEGRMRAEFARALWRLTGQPFEEDAKAWAKWWSDNQAAFQLLSDADLQQVRSGEEEWRLRQTTRVKTEFFGIRIVSHRVLFIVDVSGSMEEKLANDYQGKTGWTRMQVAREELKRCLQGLDPAAFFNLVVFSSGVERWTEGGLVPCDDKHREEALAYVDKLAAFGGTNLYDALKDAFETREVDTLFVMSDGEPSMGEVVEPLVIREHVASWNRNRGVKIHTVAVGGQFSILEWLAEDSGGTHVKFE
jgi:HEAT repeat protein